ncbi:MAG: hypothetical protein LLG44_02695, partial [Chloroflexi bacterium]|nr:hypothetical protein [Chloroflexota bacterium]
PASAFAGIYPSARLLCAQAGHSKAPSRGSKGDMREPRSAIWSRPEGRESSPQVTGRCARPP